ncbi:hypothetical protein CRG98_030565 [Punica granatum]|uniref:Uncharacterized protein n=1 Tax=Punica granatum TaxID=22663 RepID=A0A2I0IYE9_PUNGR|nr:hypothetical protein CRG98_030565 [Punica granatum]
MSGNSLNRRRGDIVVSSKPKEPLGLTPREVSESPSWLPRAMDGLLSPTQGFSPASGSDPAFISSGFDPTSGSGPAFISSGFGLASGSGPVFTTLGFDLTSASGPAFTFGFRPCIGLWPHFWASAPHGALVLHLLLSASVLHSLLSSLGSVFTAFGLRLRIYCFQVLTPHVYCF